MTEVAVWGLELSGRLQKDDKFVRVKREVLQLVRMGLRNREKI